MTINDLVTESITAEPTFDAPAATLETVQQTLRALHTRTEFAALDDLADTSPMRETLAAITEHFAEAFGHIVRAEVLIDEAMENGAAITPA